MAIFLDDPKFCSSDLGLCSCWRSEPPSEPSQSVEPFACRFSDSRRRRFQRPSCLKHLSSPPNTVKKGPLAYHIISYHIISYHIISYHIISYHIISYHIISYHIISYHIILYHSRRSLQGSKDLKLPCVKAQCAGLLQAGLYFVTAAGKECERKRQLTVRDVLTMPEHETSAAILLL